VRRAHNHFSINYINGIEKHETASHLISGNLQKDKNILINFLYQWLPIEYQYLGGGSATVAEASPNKRKIVCT
jgi:hypothetical protein